MHCRLRPPRHRFSYRVFSLFLDLDELPLIDRRLRLFSAERANLVSFRSADHGARDGSALKPWALARLAAAGVHLERPRVMLLCFPRVLGYGFNPLSIYYAYDGAALRGLVYEVNNTFGQRHAYAFPAHPSNSSGIARHGCAKAFYVSPFIGMAGRYRFQLALPGERLSVVIRQTEGERTSLLASQTGHRHPLDDRTILHCVGGDLLMTAKITGGIHFEALRLWLKGAPYFPRPHRDASPGLG